MAGQNILLHVVSGGFFNLVMAYWRSYRIFRAETNALACSDSSNEESINEQIINEPSVQSDENCPPDSLDQTNGPSASIDADDLLVSSDSDANTEEHYMDNTPIRDVCPVTLHQELASWATKYKCQRNAVSDLLDILRRQGHTLPKDPRTLLETPREVNTLTKCGGQYVYFGVESGIVQVLSKHPSFTESQTTIDLMINIDGLPLFKSSNYQFWPIMGCFNNLDVFVITLFYGNTKPNSVDEYLLDFLQEIDKVKSDGVTYESKTYRVNLLGFSCDAPARAFLKCIVGHTGYFSCERCVVKGSWEGRVVFNSDEVSVLCTEEQFAICHYNKHQKRATPLIDHDISCIQCFPLDYMHMVCLGVTKRLLKFLKNGPRECKLSSQQLSQISANLTLLKGMMPSEFARQPRSLEELDRWKATEFRQFLLYTGPIVLKNVVSDELYQHFLALSIAVSIMLDNNANKRNSYVAYARQLLEVFVRNCKHIYGNTFSVYNVHGLLHLPDDVQFFQCSLNEISCFPFENHMQQLKKLVRNGHNPIAQVARRLGERTNSYLKPSVKHRFTSVGTISSKLKDSCFLLGDNKFAFIQEKRDDGNLVCDVLSERYTENFFSTPANSRLFNIVRVRNIEHRVKRRLVERAELLYKAVCLPLTTGYVIFPMHHEVERN